MFLKATTIYLKISSITIPRTLLDNILDPTALFLSTTPSQRHIHLSTPFGRSESQELGSQSQVIRRSRMREIRETPQGSLSTDTRDYPQQSTISKWGKYQIWTSPTTEGINTSRNTNLHLQPPNFQPQPQLQNPPSQYHHHQPAPKHTPIIFLHHRPAPQLNLPTRSRSSATDLATPQP